MSPIAIGSVGFKRTLLVLAVIVAIPFGLMWMAFAYGNPLASRECKVMYYVTGPDGMKVHVAYRRPDGATEEASSSGPLPWTLTLPARAGDSVALTAQITAGGGAMTVQIFQDGVPIATSYTTEPYGTASVTAPLR